MKFNSNFERRDVFGEKVLIVTGIEHIDFNKLINLNETAADIFEQFKDKDFCEKDVVDYIVDNYDGVAQSQIEEDIKQLLEQLSEVGVVE